MPCSCGDSGRGNIDELAHEGVDFALAATKNLGKRLARSPAASE
jgi:hypothetical protein